MFASSIGGIAELKINPAGPSQAGGVFLFPSPELTSLSGTATMAGNLSGSRGTVMEPDQRLLEQLYRQEVLRARRMSGEDKLMAGPRLFQMACQITRSGIRQQHPDADERRVEEILCERLALRRFLEETSR
jgi:hypothetical protein